MGSDDAYLKRLNYLAYTKILPQQNLRVEFESFLHTIAGYENIDRLPIHGGVPIGQAAKRADAFFLGRRIIMEYKELYEGRDFARDPTILARKAEIDNAIKAAVKTDEEYLLSNFLTAQMTPGATRNMMRSFNKSLGNVERLVHMTRPEVIGCCSLTGSDCPDAAQT